MNGRGHCINEVPSSMNSPSSLLTTLNKQQLMSKFITTNIYYCCSGPSETKYFPFQNVIVNIHVPWLPTKRRTVHKKVSEPGLWGVHSFAVISSSWVKCMKGRGKWGCLRGILPRHWSKSGFINKENKTWNLTSGCSEFGEKILLRVCGRGYSGSWKGLFCVFDW